MLEGSWPEVLGDVFGRVAGAKVPYWVQAAASVGSLPLPPLSGFTLGGGLTLLDWALGPGNAAQSTANEVSVLIRSGGRLERHFAVSKDSQGRSWLYQQLIFRTTVNDQPRAYVLCSQRYPLELVD